VEVKNKRTLKKDAKIAKKQTLIGKRERTTSDGIEIAQIEEARSEGAFNFTPVIGRGARSQFGRAGMGVGSLFAATMCALALFGSDQASDLEGNISMDEMFNELQLRGLRAIDEETVEDEPVKIPKRVTQRLSWNTTRPVENQILRFYDTGDKEYPCPDDIDYFSKVRQIEDFREDYLHKTIKSHCLSQ